MRRIIRWSRFPGLALALLLGFLVAFAPSSAQAGPQTLRRSLQNILFAPCDLVLTPVVASRSWWNSWTSVDDSPAVHYGFAAPGLVWMNAIQAGTSVIRFVSGAIELPLGLLLLPLEAENDPLFDVADDNAALVDEEFAGFAIRVGINYTTSSAAY